MNITTKRHPRTLGDAFRDAEYASSIHIVHRTFLSSVAAWLRRVLNR
jgi:hypothetical protein